MLTIHGKWEGRNSQCEEADAAIPELSLLPGCAVTAKLQFAVCVLESKIYKYLLKDQILWI